MKKSGFTLAEVLITLVIIGVIAALTLGTVVSNTSKKQLESQIKKFHAQFAHAIELYMVDNNIENLDDVRDKVELENYQEFIFNYLKVTSKCETSGDSCFAEKYIISPDQEPSEKPLGGGYKLADGSVFTMGQKLTTGFAFVTFDVNGSKKPIKAGQDLWACYIHKDGSIDGSELTPEVKRSSTASELNDIVNQGYQDNCPDNQYGSCFAYLIRNDYKIED